MKYPNDLDFIFREYAKENCVAACRKLFVSLLDMIARKACIGIIRKEEEGIIKLLGVNSTLFFAPSPLRVGCDRFEVSSSRLGKGICPH
tara:strand:+ start:1583 stop:1849 length:267 start_codon:yes stop_codon:yes gene_type:complete